MKNTDHKEKIELQVEKRDKVGKVNKQLRKNGIVPGNIYGADFTPVAVSVNVKEFGQVYKKAGETGIVYVQVGSDSIPTLITNLQYHPVTNQLLHIDFRKVNLRQKLETAVPVEVVGESIAVTQLGGVMLVQTDEVTVEALPANIPSAIEVDISKITELGQEIKVSDLPKSADYEIKEDLDKVLVSVVEHKEESLEAQTERTETEITGEKAPEEGEAAEGEAAPTGDSEEK
jgi:large subunit ribosomal protein L25